MKWVLSMARPLGTTPWRRGSMYGREEPEFRIFMNSLPDETQQSGPNPARGIRVLSGLWREWPILLIMLLAAAAVWAFIEIAGEVTEGSTEAIDNKLLLLLRDSADSSRPAGPPWLREMMRDITGLGGTGVLTLITLSATGFLLLERKRHAAALLVVAVIGGTILSNALKLGFGRERPSLGDFDAILTSASFPSGHSTMAAAVYLTIGALIARVRPDPRVRAYVLLLSVLVTLLVGISRIYLGVHWPTDVLAGWAIGAAWALLCWLVALLLQRRGSVESG